MQMIGLRSSFVSKGAFADGRADLYLGYFHVTILVNS